MKNKPCNAGFTLIEVLVALAVIGLALGALAGAFSNGLTGHKTAADAEAALALAEERLALASAAIRSGRDGGNFAGRFDWQTTVSLYEDKDKTADAIAPPPRLYQVAVTVTWHDGRRGRQVVLSTLRLGPPPELQYQR